MKISQHEYDERLRNVRIRMADEGLSALLLTDPANLYYLTGYNAWSFYVPQFLFVPASGDLLFYARAMDAGGAHRTAWLPEDQIIGYPEDLVQRPYVHPFDWVGADLRERGLVAEASGGNVGLELDSHYFSPSAYLSLLKSVPEWTFIDTHQLVNWVRLVKSPTEIGLMRIAAEVTTNAMNAAIDNIRVGTRQCDVAAQISHAQISGTPEHGGDYPSIVPMLPTGVAADTPHLTWNQERFVNDQSISVELAGAHKRYHVPLARTITLGTPAKELQRVVGPVGEAVEAVLSIIRPGVQALELSDIWDLTLAKYGLSKPSRIGYSIGIGYPPDWGERTVSLRGDEETVLEENMTFHLMCGMWMDGYGYELSEPFRVSADGVETFTSLPRELIQARNQ